MTFYNSPETKFHFPIQKHIDMFSYTKGLFWAAFWVRLSAELMFLMVLALLLINLPVNRDCGSVKSSGCDVEANLEERVEERNDHTLTERIIDNR